MAFMAEKEYVAFVVQFFEAFAAVYDSVVCVGGVGCVALFAVVSAGFK